MTPLQNQVDAMVGGFVDQATDWRALAAMTAGGVAYRLGRVGVMTAGMGILASAGFGLSAEVTAFEMTHRSLSSLTGESRSNPNLWRWSGQGGIRQGLLSSFITFGSLKGAGRWVQGQNFLVQHLAQDSAMVLGHNASAALGLMPRVTGSLAEQFLHAETTNLQLGAGMAMGHALTGGGIYAVERGLDLSLQGRDVASFPLIGTQGLRNVPLLSGLMGLLNTGCGFEGGQGRPEVTDPSERLFWAGIILAGSYGIYRALRWGINRKFEQWYHGPRPYEREIDTLRASIYPGYLRYDPVNLMEILGELQSSPPKTYSRTAKIFDVFLDPHSGSIVEAYEVISPQPYSAPAEPDQTGLIHGRIGTRIDAHQLADFLESPVLSIPLLPNRHTRSREYEIAFRAQDLLSQDTPFPWTKGGWTRLLEKAPVDSKYPFCMPEKGLAPGASIEHGGLKLHWLPPRKGTPVHEYTWALLAPKIEELRKEWKDPDLELEQRKRAFEIYISLLDRVPARADRYLRKEGQILGEVWRSLPEGLGHCFFKALETINRKLFPEDFQTEEERESLMLRASPPSSSGTDDSEAPRSGVRPMERLAESGPWVEVGRLNERILQGDMEAIREGRVHYFYADESVSGNAALPNHIAVNTYVDPDSGQIVALGNMQYLPQEAIEGKVEVTFRVKVLPEDFANPSRRDFVPTITDGRLKRPVRPEVRAVLEGLIGKPFLEAPQDHSPDEDSGGSGQNMIILPLGIDPDSILDFFHHGTASLHHMAASLHHTIDQAGFTGRSFSAFALIAIAFSVNAGARASLPFSDVKSEVSQRDPLSARRARFLIGQITSPKNEASAMERYQVLAQLARRSDFQDFPALFRAMDRLGKQGQPVDFRPIVDSLWEVMGTSSADIQNRLVYLREQERLQTLARKNLNGLAVLPVYNVILASEGPSELEDMIEKMNHPRLAHAILKTEVYRKLAGDPRLKSPAMIGKILGELNHTGHLFQQAHWDSLDIAATLSDLVMNPNFSGKKKIDAALGLLPFTVGPGTGPSFAEKVLRGLLRLPGFRVRDHLEEILAFSRDLYDPADRILFLGNFANHPKVQEAALHKIMMEVLSQGNRIPSDPQSERYEAYERLTQRLVGALGEIGANPNFINFPFVIYKIRNAKISPLVRAAALARITTNPNLTDVQDFTDIIDGIFSVEKDPKALEAFLQVFLRNKRLPEDVRDDLWARLGTKHSQLLQRLVLYHRSLPMIN